MPQMDARMENLSQLAPHQSPVHSAVDKSASAPSLSESGKKKRGHRAAKLKQCKMDARREQWLAQVSGKVSKTESGASNHKSSPDVKCSKELQPVGNLDNKQNGVVDVNSNVGSCNATNGSWSGEQQLKPKDLSNHFQMMSLVSTKESHPTSSMHKDIRLNLPKSGQVKESEETNGNMVHLDCQEFSSRWSSSDTSSIVSNSSRFSSSSGGSGSGSDDDNEIEDWEVVADALDVPVSVEESKSSQPDQESTDGDKLILKPENKYRPGNCGSRMRADAGRAWRPDDVSRPPTLPRLSKQHSFPLQSGTSMWAGSTGYGWGTPPAPTHCPICTEELDTTDSSFFPCSCGFRLCLFCHHRIVIGDGRCPGCRKSYNLEASLKLSRTCSTRPRV